MLWILKLSVDYHRSQRTSSTGYAVDSKTLKHIEKVLTERGESRFQPTDDQRKAKSAFWGSFGPDSVVSPGDLPVLSLAIRFCNHPKIREWWDIEGFQDWLWNKSEFDQRLEYLAQIALDELEQTLKSRMVTAAQKIPAIKLALEVSSKLKQSTKSDVSDDHIANMNREQLQSYIDRKLKQLASTSTVLASTGTVLSSADTSEDSK